MNSPGNLLTTALTFYDAAGQVQYTVDARGAVTQNQYDGAGRRTNVLVYTAYTFAPTSAGTPNPTGAYQSTSYTYDANGNQVTVTDAAGHTTTSVYDNANRVIEVDSPATGGGTVARYTYYDGLGRKLQETDEAGVSTAYTYDFRGLLLSVTLAAGTAQPVTTVYSYDELGNEIGQTDANGHTTTFRYDALGRRTGRTLPGGQSEGSYYDPLTGNLIYQTNFNGVVITNGYDVANRLTNSASVNGYRVSYGYNITNGWRTNMVDPSGTSTWRYNAVGQLTNKVVAWANGPVAKLNYGYDALGSLTKLWSGTANGVTNAYQYDLLGRLTNVLANGSAAAGYGFDKVGNLQTMRYGNGVTNGCQYDAQNRLTNQVWKLNNTAVANFAYTLGPTGNRTALAETVATASRTYNWAYDYLHRLTGETMVNSGVTNFVNYGYDVVGNRTNRTSSISQLTNAVSAYTANDWLASDSYDANGSTTASSGNSYQYDALNHLTNANNGTVLMTYDGDGNRASKKVGGTTTYYLLDDRNPSGYVQVLEEWTVTSTATNLGRVYNYGLALISQRVPNSSTNYFICDGHGSTRALMDAGGNVVNTFAYDAYGTLIASNGLPQTAYLYCGQQYDSDLGLYLNRARYLNAGTGRFWTMDTDQGDNQNPLSLHKYVYTEADPINGSDPSGNDDVLDAIDLASHFDSLNLGQLAVVKNYAKTRITIASRSQTYNSYDYELNTDGGAIPCRWFRGAAIVTGRFGVGAADDPPWKNAFYLSSQTEDYLRTVNQLLFVWNTANFLKLDSGQEVPDLEGRRGKILDYGLVDFEQNKVENYTSTYFNGKDSSAKNTAIAEINSATASALAPQAVQTALRDRFINQGKKYSFDRLSDRIQLGEGVIDWVYANTSPLDPMGAN